MGPLIPGKGQGALKNNGVGYASHISLFFPNGWGIVLKAQDCAWENNALFEIVGLRENRSSSPPMEISARDAGVLRSFIGIPFLGCKLAFAR